MIWFVRQIITVPANVVDDTKWFHWYHHTHTITQMGQSFIQINKAFDPGFMLCVSNGDLTTLIRFISLILFEDLRLISTKDFSFQFDVNL